MIETLFLGGRIFRTRKYHRGLPVESRYSWPVFRIPAPEKLEEYRYLPRISQKSVVCLHDGNAWQTTVLTIWGMYVQYTFNVHRISRGPLPKFCLTLCLAPRIVSENNAANTVDGSGILRSPVEVGSLSHHFRDFFTSQQDFSHQQEPHGLVVRELQQENLSNLPWNPIHLEDHPI